MNTNTTTVKENNNIVMDAFETVGKIAETGLDLGLLKKNIENAVDDAVLNAQRNVKLGKYMVEDAVDDTAHFIKKNPWPAVGYAAGAGLGVGLLIGIFAARSSKSR